MSMITKLQQSITEWTHRIPFQYSLFKQRGTPASSPSAPLKSSLFSCYLQGLLSPQELSLQIIDQ